LAGIWLMNDEPSQLALQNEVDVQPVIEVLEESQEESLEESLEEDPIAQALPPLEPIELSLAPQNVTLEPKIESLQKPLLEPDVQVTITPDNKPKLDPPAPPAKTEAVVSIPELEVWPLVTSTTKQPYSFAALLKLPSDRYSLQILGARLETTIEAFVKGRKFTQPHYILQLERGGKPWFMLLVGNYASSKDARSAISSLPAALQNQKPWARPVSKIQQQIRNKFNTSGE
jgi:septal ring-binding cell division protein DamX